MYFLHETKLIYRPYHACASAVALVLQRSYEHNLP